MKIILDASAWIEYLSDSSFAEHIERHISHSDCFTLTITLAEIVAKLIRDLRDIKEPILAIQTISHLVSPDQELAINTAQIYAARRKTHPKIALSDAFIIAFARREGAKILTKDTDFAGLPEAILLK